MAPRGLGWLPAALLLLLVVAAASVAGAQELPIPLSPTEHAVSPSQLHKLADRPLADGG